jgi:carbon starvation protein CstA
MKKFYTNNEKLINIGFYIGLITFILTFSVTSIMQLNKLTILKISFLPLVFGFFYFFTSIILTIYNVNKINYESYKKRIIQKNKFKQILLITIISVLVYHFFDTFMYFIDDSLSKEYANGLLSITENPTKKDIEEINEMANLPFGIQNFIINFISIVFSFIFSLIFTKKYSD